MALEDKIDVLTAALNRKNDLLEALTAEIKRNSDLLEALTAGAKAKVEGAAAAKPAAEEKAPARPRAEKAPAKPKTPTAADMVAATTKFCGEEDEYDEDEFNARRRFVKSLLKKYEAPKMSEIAEDDRQAALDALSGYKYEPEDDIA